jgi:hypothetical protein
MRKILAGLALALASGATQAQSVITFDVQFDRGLEASGAFLPNLGPIGPGPFSSTTPLGGIVNLTGKVTLTAVPSGTQLVGTNTI